MKTNTKTLAIIFGLLTVMVVGVKCDYNYEINVGDSDDDYRIEVAVEENGLTFDEYELYVDGEAYEGGRVKEGQKMTLKFRNVQGWQVDEKGLIYPDAALSVMDPAGDVIALQADLFGDYTVNGMNPEDYDTYSLSLTLDEELESERDYEWTGAIWDSKNSDMDLRSSVIFQAE